MKHAIPGVGKRSEDDSSFKTMALNSFKGKKINYAENKVIFCYLYHFHALKQKGKQRIS